MRWYKWIVTQFEGLANLSNDGALVMQTGAGGRYSLLVHHSVEELRGVRPHRRHDRGPEFRLDPVLLRPAQSLEMRKEGGDVDGNGKDVREETEEGTGVAWFQF
jgi:hypothetical protein